MSTAAIAADMSPTRLLTRVGKDRNLKLRLAMDRENVAPAIQNQRSPRAALADISAPQRGQDSVARSSSTRMVRVSPRAAADASATKSDEVLVLQGRVRMLEEQLRAKDRAVVGVLNTQGEALLLLEEQHATRTVFAQQRIAELEVEVDALKAHVRELERRWVPDAYRQRCVGCAGQFGLFLRKHHCRCAVCSCQSVCACVTYADAPHARRLCGEVFCSPCSSYKRAIKHRPQPERVCTACYFYADDADAELRTVQ